MDSGEPKSIFNFVFQALDRFLLKWLMVIDYLIELELDTMVMWLCVCGFEGPFFLAATPGRVVLIVLLVVLVE